MIIISLNTEAGGRPYFLDYLRSLIAQPEVSVLCLQEVHFAYTSTVPLEIFPKDPGNRGTNPIRGRLYQEIAEVLGPTWSGYFAPQLIGFKHDKEPCVNLMGYGQATFVRQSAEVQIIGQTFGPIFRRVGQANGESVDGPPSCKSGIATTLQVAGDRTITVGNVHGFWSKNGKEDMPARLVQNSGIANLLIREVSAHGPWQDANVLLVGDLNYRTGMQALEHLRCQSVFGPNCGGVNLNHQFRITCTRTKHYPADKPYREADFAIASHVLAPSVQHFGVDLEAPSDHGALFVELSF